jgi:hypothetical protein
LTWAALLAGGASVTQEALPPAADPAIVIPVRGRMADDKTFAEMCGCIGKRIAIRRDAAAEFSPVAWSVRTVDGRFVTPREERGGSQVSLDMAAHKPGIYWVTLRSASGRSITRPLRVE